MDIHVDSMCYSSTSSRHLRAKKGEETRFGGKKSQNLIGPIKYTESFIKIMQSLLVCCTDNNACRNINKIILNNALQTKIETFLK